MEGVPNAVSAEYFLSEEDVLNFDRIVKEPVQPTKGVIQMPQRPGHGVELVDEAVAKYRIQ